MEIGSESIPGLLKSLKIQALVYTSLCCLWTFLVYTNLCCLWTFLVYTSLCCLWTFLVYTSL
jgi:hypothetical protein